MQEPFDARRLLGRWTNWIALVGAVGILVLASAVVVDVLVRVLFNSPILGVDDLAKLILALIVSSFFPVCLVGGHFVTIRFLGKFLGAKGGSWLEVAGGLGTLFVFCLLAWQFFRFTLFDVTLTGLGTVVLELPQAPWWWAVTVIIIACVPVQFIVLIDAVIRAVKGRVPAYDISQKTEASTGG
ncbi:MAG: TRAP transporter small permease subunit [Pseudomonadota bacterium]|nr:TRAP transporter small permease subunit [Pseudomonadota bacterium]